MISDNRKARGDAARFRIVSCSRKGQFPPQGRGADSFLEKNPPHTLEEKHQGVSTSLWTPNDTKAGGLGPRLWKPTPKGTGDEGKVPPLWKPLLGMGERQRKEKQRVSYLHPVVLHARRCGGALI